MGGGLMQLVAYGAQDIYLTGNPQITFFKIVYRRHTNFSMESIKQTFSGRPSTGDSEITATISRNGDLVSRLWLECSLDRTGLDGAGNNPFTYINWTNNTGHALIKECEIEIGGQKIDRHYSQWLDIWNELTDHEEKAWPGLNKHESKEAYLEKATPGAVGGTVSHPDLNDYFGALKLYIPLQFWFCRNPGLALPLIALQYHEVKLKLKTRGLNSLLNAQNNITSLPTNPPEIQLYVDYIYLDTDERRRFAQVSHEYLIEQLQYISANDTTIELNFNHPVKELIWTGVRSTTPNIHIPSMFQRQELDGQPSCTYNIKLNGHDRFSERHLFYFTRTQRYQHHTKSSSDNQIHF